ncbi:MAG: hypothetical protein H7338_17185 [Candidatus Sericytochromatia bacterium]|nr:hypothetical protein [Candidatus Sericytochromatia bacterium]
MSLKITRLHELARKAKVVTSQRADYDAAVYCKENLDELIDAYLDSVFILGQYETTLPTMFKKERPDRDKAVRQDTNALSAQDPDGPLSMSALSHFFLSHPGPHAVTADFGFSYVEREPYLVRGRGSSNNYEGSGTQLDYVLKGEPDGRLMLAQYKSAIDTPPFNALVQLVAYSAMVSNEAQMNRLRASCPDAGFAAPPSLPMDLCLIFNHNGRTKNQTLNNNWDDSLAVVQVICQKLVRPKQIARYIRQIHLVQATVGNGTISFAAFAPAAVH